MVGCEHEEFTATAGARTEMSYAKPLMLVGSNDQPTTSALIADLLTEFEQQKVQYCYWKSSRRLHLALAGASDLDILVAPLDRMNAVRALDRIGFKAFPSSHNREHSAVISFIGFDETSGLIHHVHLHFRIVLGNAMVKNWVMPRQDEILARTSIHQLIPIRMLDPADAAVLLIVRAALELRRSEPIAIRQWGALNKKFSDELVHLREQVSHSAFTARASQIFSGPLANDLANTFVRNSSPRISRRLRVRIESELSAYRCFGRLQALARTVSRSFAWILNRVNKSLVDLPHPSMHRPSAGGLVIAVVGVDGSGKSTLVSTLSSWLGSEVDVGTLYFGTGDGRASLFMRPFKSLSPFVASFFKVKPRGASHGKISDKPAGRIYSILFTIWAILAAAEKRHKLKAARRAACRGTVVITDRYPQLEIPTFNDGPLLHRLPHTPGWLSRYETEAYELARRAPPDLVIKLHVGSETVARREPEMDKDVVRDRIASFARLRFPGVKVVSIDADRPKDEVVRLAKRAVWESL